MFWRLRQPIHSSWLVAVAASAVVIGVWLAQYVRQPFLYDIAWLLTGLSLVSFGIWKQKIWVILPLVIGGLLVGCWRGASSQISLKQYQPLLGRSLTVHGLVGDDPDINARGNMVLRLSHISVQGQPFGATMWVSINKQADIKRGDYISVNGKLKPGFGVFAATISYGSLEKIERPQPGDIARRVRDWFGEATRAAIPEPQASLGLGYLVGQRRALPADLEEALRVVGLTHVVVASGYNLTILVRLARRLFIKVSRYAAMAVAGGLVVAFILITGLSPSMLRAGLVAGLSLLAWYYGRNFHPMVLLPLVAGLTVLINPSYAWGDLGWGLSFVSFAGVMILAPLLQQYFFGTKPPGIMRQILGETIAATVATAPLILLAFGTFSNVALLANLLVLPFVPLAMLLTFIAGLASLALPAVATIIALPATWLLGYMIHVARWLADLSWAQTTLVISWWQCGLIYGGLIGLGLFLWWRTRLSLREVNLVE